MISTLNTFIITVDEEHDGDGLLSVQNNEN